MSDLEVHAERRVRTMAWISLGTSALVAAVEILISSEQGAPLLDFVFGYNIFGALAFSGGIYLAALVFDIVTAAVLKGWRNRVVAISGIFLLQVPILIGVWVAENSIVS